MKNLFTLLLFLAVIAEAAALYWGYENQQEMQLTLASQQQQISQLQAELAAQQQALSAIEEKSVGAMVKKANTVIVEGWDAIATSVESELEKARSALQSLNEEPAPE